VITLQVASGFSICEGLGALPGKNLSCLCSPSIPGSFVEVGLSPEAVEPGVSAWLAGLAGHSAYGLLALRWLPDSMPANIGSCSSAPLFAAAAVNRSSSGKPDVAPNDNVGISLEFPLIERKTYLAIWFDLSHRDRDSRSINSVPAGCVVSLRDLMPHCVPASWLSAC
jgi:hypothetical protein